MLRSLNLIILNVTKMNKDSLTFIASLIVFEACFLFLRSFIFLYENFCVVSYIKRSIQRVSVAI